jgi:hypothetical protein
MVMMWVVLIVLWVLLSNTQYIPSEIIVKKRKASGNRPRVALAPSHSCALGTASQYFSGKKYCSGVRFSIGNSDNTKKGTLLFREPRRHEGAECLGARSAERDTVPEKQCALFCIVVAPAGIEPAFAP